MSADKDRYLRDKINEDSSHLVRENATLNQQVLEMEKQLERVSEGGDGETAGEGKWRWGRRNR